MSTSLLDLFSQQEASTDTPILEEATLEDWPIDVPSEEIPSYDLLDRQVDLLGRPIRVPLIDRHLLSKALQETLHGISLEALVSMLTNEYAELIEYARLCRGEDACRRTSLLFNPHRLTTRCGNGAVSIFEALQDPHYFPHIARATLLHAGKASDLLYQVLQFGFNFVQWCNEFPPLTAYKLCERYELNADSIVLDPCAGWGGRMLGISVFVDNYVCYDPSSRTVKGLEGLTGFINRVRPGFNSTIHCIPFEESTGYGDGIFDLALTSPPYFDTEKYSDEETNSLNRYPDFYSWCKGFYFPLIDKTMRQLKPDAPFIFNIGDRRYPLTKMMYQHCEEQGYRVLQVDNFLGYNNGLGRQAELGEKFFEIRQKGGGE